MPTTLTSLFVLLFAIIPGVVGEKFYRVIAGEDWRAQQQQTRRIIRIFAVSIGGLVGYVLLAGWTHLPQPVYIFPSSFAAPILSDVQLREVAFAYIGHTLIATLLGLAVGWIVMKTSEFGSVSAYPDTWDRFARSLVENHWVLVTLTSGETYAGMIEKADISVQQKERDIVLVEPALYDEETNEYHVLPYQYFFVPGALVGSIAVYYNPEIDVERETVVGQVLFEA